MSLETLRYSGAQEVFTAIVDAQSETRKPEPESENSRAPKLYQRSDQELLMASLDQVHYMQQLPAEIDAQGRLIVPKSPRIPAKELTRLHSLLNQHEEIVQDLDTETKDQVIDTLHTVVKKRDKSRTGLIASLITRGFITKEDVNPADGSINIQRLQANSYFADKQDVLAIVGEYHLGERSKLRQEAAVHTDTAVQPAVAGAANYALRNRVETRTQSADALDFTDHKDKKDISNPFKRSLARAGLGFALTAGVVLYTRGEKDTQHTNTNGVIPNVPGLVRKEDTQLSEIRKQLFRITDVAHLTRAKTNISDGTEK